MEKFSRSKRYNLISLFTFLVIAITFGYYYFFYVNTREVQFNEKAFRVIENIGQNVNKKYLNYYSNVNKAIKHINKYDDGVYNKNEESLQKGFGIYDVPEEVKVVKINRKGDKKPLTVEEFQSQLAEDEMGMIVDLNSNDTVLCKYKTANLFEKTLRVDFFKKFVVISVEKEVRKDNSPIYNKKLLHSDIPLVFNNLKVNNEIDTSFFGKKMLVSTRLARVNYEGNEHNLYISPIDIGTGTTLFIGGVIEKDFFRSNTFSLEPFSFSIIIVVLVMLILLLPFLKLYLISENERLNTVDAVFSFISIVAGSAFVFLIMLNWQSREKNSDSSQRELLLNYSNNMESELKSEIEESLKLLDDFDALPKNVSDKQEFVLYRNLFIVNDRTVKDFKPNIKEEALFRMISGFKLNIQSNLEDSICISGFKNVEVEPIFKYDRKITNYKSEDKAAVFWTNNKGDQLIKWSTKTNTPRVSVKSRSYFQRVAKGDLWTDSDLYDEPFFMHAIFSMTDGNNYMMFSKESHDTNTYTQLPAKFRLEIEKGTKDSDLLKPKVVVLAKKLSSLKDLPLPSNISYMLVDEKGEVLYHQIESKILQENLLNETLNNPELIGALQTHSDTVFFANYDGARRGFYVRPIGKLPIYLVTSVNSEHERITDIQTLGLSGLLYLLLIIMLSAQIGLFVLVNQKSKNKITGRDILFCWFWPDKRKHQVYKALSVYLVLAILNYFVFRLNANIFITLSYFSLLATSVIFVLKWYHDTCESNNRIRNVFYTLLVLGLNGVLIYNSYNLGMPSNIYYGYFLFLLFSFVFYFWVKLRFIEVESFSNKSLIWSYSIFVFLIVLSLGLLPVIGFYGKSYNLEKELYMRSMQLDLARNRFSAGNKDFTRGVNLNKGIFEIEKARDAIRVRNSTMIFGNDTLDCTDGVLTKNELEFVKNLRYAYDKKMYNSASISFMQCDSNRLFNWYSDGDKSVLCDEQHLVQIKSTPDTFKVLSSGQSFNYFIFILVGFIIYCFVFFHSVRYWVSKIFLLGLPHKKKKDEFELIIQSFRFIYLISLPHSGVKRYLNNRFEEAHIIPVREYAREDFIKLHLSQIEENQSRSVILYDSDSYTEQLIETKTGLIVELIKQIQKKDSALKKLILVSNTHPSYKVKKIKRKDENDTIALDQYLNVLGNFKRVFFPFGFLPIKSEAKKELAHLVNECDCEEPDSWNRWKARFYRKDHSGTSILNVQSLSQIQYFSIWNGLEKREQYLIYDLAQDGLANYKNIGVINNLISKGMLKYDNMQLKIFNESFTNFVLTNIDREESLQIEHESKKSGNWSNLQLPIIMVIFALFAFLFITQQDAFNDIIAWLGTALISLPLLLKTFSGFSSFKFGSGKS